MSPTMTTGDPSRRAGAAGPQAEAAPSPRPPGEPAGPARAPLGNRPTARPTLDRKRLLRGLQSRMRFDEHRVAGCSRFAAPRQGIAVRTGADGAYFSGLAACGSLSCPVCGPRIRHGRAQEVARAAEAHTKAGGGLVFVTLTVPHRRGDDLDDLWRIVADAFRSVLSGGSRKALRERFGWVGHIRATETTYGSSGWHVHVHLLGFLAEPLDDLDAVSALWRWIHGRWAKRVEAEGGRRPSLTRGCQVIPCRSENDALAKYLVAVGGIGPEMAHGQEKGPRAAGSRSPIGLLADAVDHGDRQAWALWRSWLDASKGRRIVEWSRGLRGHLGIGDASSDEELMAEENSGSEHVVTVDRGAWRELLAAGRTVDLLAAVDAGGITLAVALLRVWRVPVRLHQGRAPTLTTKGAAHAQ
jgi:hypothetical protein